MGLVQEGCDAIVILSFDTVILLRRKLCMLSGGGERGEVFFTKCCLKDGVRQLLPPGRKSDYA
jgi:hypothetical protein